MLRTTAAALCLALVASACGAKFGEKDVVKAYGAGGVAGSGAGSEAATTDEATLDASSGTGGSETGNATAVNSSAGRPQARAGTGSRVEATRGVSAEKLVIGATFPLSGATGREGSIFGGAVAGMSSYIRLVNERGGINGRKLELHLEDDQSSPSGCAAAARKLVEEKKVFAVVGSINSPALHGCIPYLEKVGVPLVGPDSIADDQFLSPVVFPFGPSLTRQHRLSAWFMTRQLGVKRVSIVYTESEAGNQSRDELIKRFGELGVEVVSVESSQIAQADFTPQVIRLRAANPDAIMLIIDPLSLVNLFHSAERQDYRPPKGFHGNAAHFGDFVPREAGSFANGFYAGSGYTFPTSTDPAVKEFVQTMKRFYPNGDRPPRLVSE